MRPGRPSQTAALVAYMRALANIGATSAAGFSDPTASVLLPPLWSKAFGFAERKFAKARPDQRRQFTRGVDALALRTLAIDQSVSEALARGVRQVVILGAGLDGRAYRLAGIERADVFEVDHPATQSYKRRRASALKARARSITHVSVNFERDSLDTALAASGHRGDEPTFWVWEGVVTYLTDEAVRETLKAVVARSANGSGIVISYSEHNQRSFVRRLIFGAMGEPQIGARQPEAMARLVTEAGIVIEQDSGISEWAERFQAEPPFRRLHLRALVGRVR